MLSCSFGFFVLVIFVVSSSVRTFGLFVPLFLWLVFFFLIGVFFLWIAHAFGALARHP